MTEILQNKAYKNGLHITNLISKDLIDIFAEIQTTSNQIIAMIERDLNAQ